jgi:hypothetical protein
MENQPSQQHEPIQAHDIPSQPWTKIATDIFTLDGADYVLLVDYHSKYPVVRRIQNMKSATVASIFSDVFSMFGPPSIIMSDNGTQYSGLPFQEMCEAWSIQHITSSPRYARSNGLAERTVRTLKQVMKKCRATKNNVDIALLHLRATPIDSRLPSPAEMMFGRQIRTTLPSYQNRTEDNDYHNLLQKQDRMKDQHDKRAGPDLAPLYPGQKVYMQDTEKQKWTPATVTDLAKEPRSYIVETPNGGAYRRNRTQLRELSAAPKVPKRVKFAEDTKQDPPEQEQLVTQNPHHITTRSGRVIHKPPRYRDEC